LSASGNWRNASVLHLTYKVYFLFQNICDAQFMTTETSISNFITSAVMDRHQSRYFIDMCVFYVLSDAHKTCLHDYKPVWFILRSKA